MTDLPYATLRKPTSKQHRTLSYNTQSSINKNVQQPTIYNNTATFTKRKTPSKRYMMNTNTNIYTNETQINNNNKTIDFSAFRTHQKTLSVGKQAEFMPLPEIHVAKNKRGAKKGSYLQIWLNQALDEGQGNQNFLTNLNDQTLGSLKKYGIDRKLLKAKNISQQTIDKIYKKLYIYSKGLGMTFQQISKLAQTKSPFEQQSTYQSNGKQIVEIFWRVFSKLMENQTPFESAFQVMEKNYLKKIQEMQQKLHSVSEEVAKMQNAHKQEKHKLQKELQMFGIKYKQLQTEFTVNKSTLQLTNQSLDTEIELRLKFQAKINSVYTSYNDMKTKYACLVEELGVKKELNMEQQQTESKLKENLQSVNIKCKELEHLLSLEQAKVRDLRAQLLIKNEQKSDLQKEILSTEQNANKQSDTIAQYMQKTKLLAALLSQGQIEMARMNKILSQQKEVNSKLSQRVSGLSELNKKLYQDKYKLHEHMEQLNKKNLGLANDNKLKQYQINTLTNEITGMKGQLSALTDELSQMKQTNNDIHYQLHTKTMLLAKADESISKMKDTKDRYQRLFALVEHQKNQTINSNTTLMAKFQSLQLQVQNLNNQLIQKQQSLAVQMTNFKNAKQLLTKKVRSLEQHLNKKDQTILRHMNTIQHQGIQMLKKQREINKLRQTLQTKQSLIYKMQSESVLLATNQPLIEELLKKKQSELNQQVVKNMESLLTQNMLKAKIEETQMLLNAKSAEIHLETECYKRLAQSYKEMYDQRKEFIHPLIHEDMLSCVVRGEKCIKQLKQKVQEINKKNQSSRLQLQQAKQENGKLVNDISKLYEQIKSLKCTGSNLQSQNATLRKQLKQEIDKSLMIIEQQKRQSSQIAFLTNEKLFLQKQLEVKTVEISSLTQKVNQFISKVEKLQYVNEQIEKKCQQSQKAFALFKQSSNVQQKQIICEKQVQKCHVYVQTEDPRINTEDFSHISIATQNISRSHNLTQNKSSSINKILENKFQNLQSKEITRILIQHSSQQSAQFKRYQQNLSQTQKITIQPQRLIEKQALRREQKSITPTQKKKVDKSEFKRALKLTFMRR